MTDYTSLPYRCRSCDNDFPRNNENFPKNNSARDGLGCYCKACHCEKQRQYRNRNPESVKASARKWRSKNKTYISKYNDRYWRTHPEITHEHRRRRRSRRAQLETTLTYGEWETILAYYEYGCAYCGKKWYDLTKICKDHVIPLAKGGGYTKENIVPACYSCNCRKHDLSLEQAGMQLVKPINDLWEKGE